MGVTIPLVYRLLFIKRKNMAHFISFEVNNDDYEMFIYSYILDR